MDQQLLCRPTRNLKRKSDVDLQKSAINKRKPPNSPAPHTPWECCNCFKIVATSGDVCTNCGISRCQKCTKWLGDDYNIAEPAWAATEKGLELEEDNQAPKAYQPAPCMPAPGKSAMSNNSRATEICHPRRPQMIENHEQTPTRGSMALKHTPDRTPEIQRMISCHPSTPVAKFQEKMAGTGSLQ